MGLDKGVHKEDPEFMSQALVVGFFLVFELLGVLEELAKGLGELLAEDFFHGLQLDLEDIRVLFEFVGPADSLPGQVTPQELDNHVGNGLEIIPSAQR